MYEPQVNDYVIWTTALGMIHTYLICYEQNWHELKFVKKRTDKMCEHYSQYDDVYGRDV